MATAVLDGLAALRDGLADLYRDLHRNPELSLHETRTAALLAERLRAAGADEVVEGVGGTGVVAVVRSGDGPVVMVRADIDALPVEERTGLAYASTARADAGDGAGEVPVMHACGHDMHAACLVGAVALLAGARDAWRGTLLAVLQPAEELGRGARDMVEDGLFTRFPRPEIVLGQHVAPLPAGFVGHGSGLLMASADSLTVTLHGRGGHGSRPEATVDPVLMAASTVVRLQGVVAREVPPAESAVVTVGRLRAGEKDNIIPDDAELGLNIRARSESARTLVRAAVERIVRAEAAASGAPRVPDLEWHASVPALVSDPAATARTLAAFTAHFGEGRIIPMPPVNASEDVGVFGAAIGIPTVFWFWGGLDADLVLTALAEDRIDSLPSNHSPEFAPVLAPTLDTGVEALTIAALTWLAPA